MSWIACVWLLLRTSYALKFCPVTSPFGDAIYITDNPSKVVSVVTRAGCASQCAFYTSIYGVTSSTCRCFNYDVALASCSLFAFEPSNSAVTGDGFVMAFQYSDSPLTGLFPTVTSDQCSLSYEYGDQIYSGDCRYFKPTCDGQSSFGCLLPSGRPAYCSQAVKAANVSLALKKPAIQQSTYDSAVASLANDGYLGTSSCTSAAYLNPWWAVDLGQPYLIASVEVVNNGDITYAYRLNNFFVKLSNVQPIVGQRVSLVDSTLCAQYNGNLAAGNMASVACTKTSQPYRYVIVQGSLTSTDAICLLEVRVYGSLVPPHPVVRSRTCSYPYTFEGVLYYRCMQNVSSATTISYQYACLTTNRTLSTCYSPADYVAQITNYTVKAPGQVDQITPSVSGWIAFLLRKTGPSDGLWDLPWTNYVGGFGFRDTYLWLGLERIHQLTTSGSWGLRLEYYYNNKWVSAEYQRFSVGDSTTAYTLSYYGYVGDDDDDRLSAANYSPDQNSLWNSKGMRFSTKDKDNDKRQYESCNPSFSQGGWWYNNCGAFWPTANSPILILPSYYQYPITEVHIFMRLN